MEHSQKRASHMYHVQSCLLTPDISMQTKAFLCLRTYFCVPRLVLLYGNIHFIQLFLVKEKEKKKVRVICFFRTHKIVVLSSILHSWAIFASLLPRRLAVFMEKNTHTLFSQTGFEKKIKYNNLVWPRLTFSCFVSSMVWSGLIYFISNDNKNKTKFKL